jgi:hypothetical protein
MMLAVVNSVAIPPRIVPNASGISRRDGAVRVCRERLTTAGSRTPPAARLFMNSESSAAASVVNRTARFSPPPLKRSSRWPSIPDTPVTAIVV